MAEEQKEREFEIKRLEEELFTEEDALRYHIKIGKWVGVVLIAMVFSVPALVVLCSSLPVSPSSKPYLNDTACVYIKQFDLSEGLFATVCNIDGDIFLDIRQFLNTTATIKGVHLSLLQWSKLIRYSGTISRSITEARTFWKDLKTL